MEAEKLVDEPAFRAAYRMSPATFDELVQLLGPHVEKQVTTFMEPIGAAERVGITLRRAGQADKKKAMGKAWTMEREWRALCCSPATSALLSNFHFPSQKMYHRQLSHDKLAYQIQMY